VVKIEVRDYGLSELEQDELWRRWRDGQSVSSRRELGKPFQHLRRFMAQTGGVRPPAPRPARWHLSLSEREEISRGIAAEQSARTIAERLGRRASTVSREVSRHGGREAYRAQAAHARATENRRRPKTAKLAGAPRLRAVAALAVLAWALARGEFGHRLTARHLILAETSLLGFSRGRRPCWGRRRRTCR